MDDDAHTENRDIDAINRRLDRDRKHWWTRWVLVQGRHVVLLVAIGFAMGIATAGFVYSIGAWMR